MLLYKSCMEICIVQLAVLSIAVLVLGWILFLVEFGKNHQDYVDSDADL